jgi:hypothetical protein
MLEHDHPAVTRRHGYRYRFTAKHHGGHGDGQWSDSLSEDDEFAIFDDADDKELTDDDGSLFGAMKEGDDSLCILGYYHEQIAKFPVASEGSPWHGYPVWPLGEAGPSNRRKCQPGKEVFDKMVVAGLINNRMRKRLMKGDHV